MILNFKSLFQPLNLVTCVFYLIVLKKINKFLQHDLNFKIKHSTDRNAL